MTSGAVTSALAVSTAYNIDGAQQFVKTPAAGGLPSEQVETRYNSFGLPATLQGTSGYVNGSSYSPLGQVSQLDLATSPAAGIKHMFVANTYQDGTDRLEQTKVTDDTHPYELQELNYDYDDAGNVTDILDPATLGGTGKADNQCFTYDGYDRMTEAWTPATANCSASNRTAASLGGASPYWTSYTYTAGGLRSTQTDHTTAGSTLATYCYNDAAHVHGLTAVIPAATCTGAPTQYTYDATGNTQTRPKGTATESLGWNTENRLASVKVPSGTTTDTTNYLYDADGALLIRSDDSGETVLYLDGVTEVHLKKTGTTTAYWAQRTYTLSGMPVAVRTNQPGQPTLSWTTSDQHGTGSLAVTATGTDQTATKRYTTPFGAPRTGGTGTWPDDKGFLGKPQDNTTGLTYVGARPYDTATGRFISVDPVLNTSDDQSLNGYAYADNNPATNSDPTGLLCVRGDCNAPGAGLNGGNGPAPGDDLYDENVDYCNKHDCDHDGDPDATNGPTQDIVGDPLPPLPANNRATFLWMYNLQLQVSIKYHMHPHMESQKWAAAMQACDSTDACTAGESRAYMWAFLVALAHEDPSIVMGSARSMGGGFGEFSGFSVLGSEKDVAIFEGRFCRHSFVANTDVELADGQTKDIEDVEVGDKVITTDPDTGKTAVRLVIATIITDDDMNFTDLTVESDGTSASIVATDTHPFWVINEGRWVNAGDLAPGMRLRDDKGHAVPVLAARHFRQQQRTYDLTVDDFHTYYVLVGATPVLVHNLGGPSSPGKGDEGTRRLIGDLEAKGYIIRGTEISATAANGVNVRFDVVAEKNGALHFYDAKNGPKADFSKNQGRRGGYASIESGGGTFYGKNAADARLSGSFGPTDVEIGGYGGYPYTGRCR
ncbi:polymorphic toxin-type HINT domain-containing protein [Streptomyces sp. NBC_01477]|uniref:polymorphic toxin-type HINT domain-containing protein n=1 Tax=Streptomyces sp. NBC_01477 TaxID=2976015 RepID=UPI002E2FB755|nr:polymorphic toxin-type HINT domain-containing protein [Streptomyces sp. NBC_01477]